MQLCLATASFTLKTVPYQYAVRDENEGPGAKASRPCYATSSVGLHRPSFGLAQAARYSARCFNITFRLPTRSVTWTPLPSIGGRRCGTWVWPGAPPVRMLSFKFKLIWCILTIIGTLLTLAGTFAFGSVVRRSWFPLYYSFGLILYQAPMCLGE
ncbi:hypothetical protein B0H16DRAFT_215141 [Mycena metata]|uniref:Uncharacterized protein n=1 Tax=Mycena metata TaxID=1033252 RepID=A0AAD7JVX3_9AGAR|nr:hypothetical protein B0H16DRAFT_215141 [Mycena metata]